MKQSPSMEASVIKSRYTQTVEDGDRAVLWHSLFGNPQIVSSATLRFLDIFTTRRSLGSILEEYDLDEDGKRVFETMLNNYYLIPAGFDERKLLAEKAHVHEGEIINGLRINYLGLIMSEACNFRCTYCIHFNNLKTSDRTDNKEKFMHFGVAKEAVDRFLEILRQHKKDVAEVNFGGGEPLLAWTVIEQILAYCETIYGHEFTFRFSINTNASLLTPRIAQKLREHNVEIASSLDGLREGNDRVRLTKSGRGTFDTIIKGLETLATQEYPITGIAVTVTNDNFPLLDEKIIDWAVKQHMKEVRIDIDVIGMIEIPVEKIVEKLMGIRRYAQERGIEISGFWTRPSENLNESPLKSHVAFCGAVRGNSMCINPSGNIYGCGYSTKQLGTLAQIQSFYAPKGAYHHFVRDRLPGTIEMCKDCSIEGQCSGGCNITREFADATKTAKIERMCDFYRQMTRQLLFEQLRAEKGGDNDAEDEEAADRLVCRTSSQEEGVQHLPEAQQLRLARR